MSLILRVIAVILFFIGVMLAFGWFGVTADIAKAVGWIGLGLIAYVASTFAWDSFPVGRRAAE